MSTYYVDKTTGTSADTLLMAGFADFLNRLHGKSIYGNQSLVIEDCGPYWQIGCDTVTLTDENLEQVMPFDLLKLLVTQKQREKLGADLEHIFDYDAEQARRATFTAQKADLPSRYRAPGAEMVSSDPVEQERLNQIMGNQPDPDLPLFAAINQMKVAGSYNDLVQRWHVLMANPLLFRGMIRLLLQLFGSTPNPLEETEQQFAALIKSQKGLKPDATLLQIVNPTTGKGINRTKADSLALGGVDGCWLFELLKFAGFLHWHCPNAFRIVMTVRRMCCGRGCCTMSICKGLCGTFGRFCGRHRRLSWMCWRRCIWRRC
ncbi:MAG: hypothetical protein HC837_18400 [Chloroflexaceae bacterium]|nr:hypothetical protein [Chloroflexaceae bacterium]